MVMTTLGVEFDELTFLPVVGMRGGILMAWKSSVCKGSMCFWFRFSLNSRKVHHGGLLVCMGINPMR
jgi:hypothetical protein